MIDVRLYNLRSIHVTDTREAAKQRSSEAAKQRSMDVRIFLWPRFVALFEDFRELFTDHLNRVKNKSSLDHYEARNTITEWEWRVMLSMCGTRELIPAPFSSESLSVYMLMFRDDVEYEELLKIRDGRTPLDAVNQWGEHKFGLVGCEVQNLNSSFESRHVAMKRAVRVWLKRWNVKHVKWTSRNRSVVCKVMGGMIRTNHPRDSIGTSKHQVLDNWIAARVSSNVK